MPSPVLTQDLTWELPVSLWQSLGLVLGCDCQRSQLGETGAKGSVQKGSRQEWQAAPSSDLPKSSPGLEGQVSSCTAALSWDRAVPCHGLCAFLLPHGTQSLLWQLLAHCQAVLALMSVLFPPQGSPASRDSSFQDTETDSSGAPLLQVYC